MPESANHHRDGHDGVFVVFEGIDGAGTTTQSDRYAAQLRSRRRLVHVTHEPSGGPVGALIRLVLTHRISLPATKHAETMALLFAADRLDHVEAEVEPFLRDGYVIVSDRYDLSSLAYQSISATDPGSSDALGMVGWIRQLNAYARRPDATLVLDVTADVAASRRRARGGPRELFDDAALQERLVRAYQRAEALVPNDRVIHIDGNGDVDTVAAAVVAALEPIVG